MGQINIYRIASHKRQDCLVRLNRDFIIPAPPKTIYREDSTTYTLTFYYLKELPAKDVSWAWVFRTYAIPLPEVKGSPKGIITISIMMICQYMLSHSEQLSLLSTNIVTAILDLNMRAEYHIVI